MTRPRLVRSLALLITVAAFCLFVLGGWMLWRGQPRSVAAIEEFGGAVYYADQMTEEEPFPSNLPEFSWFERRRRSFVQPVRSVNLAYQYRIGAKVARDTTSDAIVAYVEGFPQLRFLALKNSQTTDSAMVHVGGLPMLKSLYMYDAQITDVGIAELRGLQHLTRLTLINGARIGDDALESLGTLTQLKHLGLQGGRFSDRGLAHLVDLTELESLWLGSGDNTITDAGLRHLVKLQNLRVLGLQTTQITDEGLDLLIELRDLQQLFVGNIVSDDAKQCLMEELPGLEVF